MSQAASAAVASHALPEPPAFNLQHAVHVAAYAFSAYLEPVEARALHELSPDNAAAAGGLGTETQYFSRRFITDHFEAAVTITVDRAEGLPAKLTNANTSVEVTSGHSFGHTSVATGGAWGDEFTLWPRYNVPDDHTLNIALLRHGDGDRDGGTTVATASLTLPALNALLDTTEKVELRSVDGAAAGSVALKIHVAPFRGKDASVPLQLAPQGPRDTSSMHLRPVSVPRSHRAHHRAAASLRWRVQPCCWLRCARQGGADSVVLAA